MKEVYEAPECEVITFETEDIITTSPNEHASDKAWGAGGSGGGKSDDAPGQNK